MQDLKVKKGTILQNDYDGIKSIVIEVNKEGLTRKVTDKKGLKEEFGNDWKKFWNLKEEINWERFHRAETVISY